MSRIFSNIARIFRSAPPVPVPRGRDLHATPLPPTSPLSDDERDDAAREAGQRLFVANNDTAIIDFPTLQALQSSIDAQVQATPNRLTTDDVPLGALITAIDAVFGRFNFEQRGKLVEAWKTVTNRRL